MIINMNKSEIVRITRKKRPIIGDYYVNGQRIEVCNRNKDLGLITNSDLSWNAHIDTITAKSKRTLGLVKRTCMELKDISTLRTIYCSLLGHYWSILVKHETNIHDRILID